MRALLKICITTQNINVNAYFQDISLMLYLSNSNIIKMCVGAFPVVLCFALTYDAPASYSSG
jgi:hypothetical protein